MFIQDEQSVAAGATVYPFAGKVGEFLRMDGLCEIACNGSATGLVFDVIVGDRVATQAAAASLINRTPQYPEDYSIEAGGFGGERVVLAVRNTTAGALTAFTALKFTPA